MSETLELFLVEDDDDFAYLMRKSLERAGHKVTVCHNGADALIVLGHSQFQLVLLDHGLPDMGGLELLHTLKREGIVTPVLMVTGRGDEHLATQVLRAGALDYVVKDSALTFLADLPKRVQESVTRHRLQQTNRLLIEALESARDGVLITDLQGVIQHVNGALERMFGYEREELAGQTPRVFKSNVHARELYEELWRTILARSSWQGELINRRKDGTLLDVSLAISPILDSRGQLTHFVGIYRDITERKLMERQLFHAQKMQSVGTLAGGVAHEFNNLLAGVQGYASLGLRETGVPATARQFFEFIVQLSDRAANLTRQLLAFARKPALTRQPTSMVKLLQTTANLVRTSLKVEVEVEAPQTEDDQGLLSMADSNQLQQVLINLALNARDAMPQPAPHPVVFRLQHVVLAGEMPGFPDNVPAGDYVVLSVADRGAGMSQAVLSQALDPFFTTKDVGQGTGLGLPVAFGIIHGHFGFLNIQSEVGKGTRVSLYLPRLTAAGPIKVAVQTPVLEPDHPPGKNILVIDDEEAVLDVVRRFLQIAGHTVHCATSAKQGLELMHNGPSMDMAILDLMIPHEEGSANFRALRARSPKLPILLCTGLLQNDQSQQMLQQEGVDLLRKPFRMNELWYAVNKAIS
ncbi:MAG: response regulator [Gemmataceae bacterium]|nr:response regulator [Gemmataceae bacterium]MCI0738378.1 response regulator [Gemmataceae bacterium]